MPTDERAPRDISKVSPDTTQLKAMAHPVRLKILGMLRMDGPATASGLAARLGLNSGATSYHLRQLADAGLIVDDDARGNGRDRWWRAAHESTTTRHVSWDEPEKRAAVDAFIATAAGQMVAVLQESVAERPELPEEWAEVTDASDYGIWLTPAQVKDVTRQLHEVLSQVYRSAPTREEAGPDTAQVFFQLHAFPAPGRLPHRAAREMP
ncbi:ArsR/SmtB family transcription factor [Rudaeicoccus suwonensis]|uniref:ArsR family transcriptional regulator n=1 Tax=Rudaeicoccus suwonensis TaxID=657409 RepID=A0A561E1H9_9MICO|nr:winged helix-turn-helix domain-containing protein [Rudaeicoccus suwonensis]TWE09441.1 ArsR family transcriptional regulator [Rudaeicoccus suwonensis]